MLPAPLNQDSHKMVLKRESIREDKFVCTLCQPGVLRHSVVKCLTRNPGVLDSSCIGSSGIFVGVSMGKTLQSPSLVLVGPRRDKNDVFIVLNGFVLGVVKSRGCSADRYFIEIANDRLDVSVFDQA